MRISRVKLNNYFCYYDAPEFELGPGINFVVGKNNTGKTALINALSLEGPWRPHRSLTTLPAPGIPLMQDHKRGIVLEYAPTEREIDRLESVHLDQFEEPNGYSYSQEDRNLLRGLLAHGLRLRLTYEYNSWDNPSRQNLLFNAGWDSPEYPSRAHAAQSFSERLQKPVEITSGLMWMAGWLRFSATDSMSDRIFKFDAERRVPATGSQSANQVLASDASNLPQTLRWLQGQGTSFWSEYFAAVKKVLPEIMDLRLVPNDDETATITVDYYPPPSRRPDLGVSLDDCGTGVGQVLAMVYAVMHFDETSPRIFLIDEPNSFLHPGAIRSLLEIFQAHDHHQYIMATHSPTAIMATQQKTMLLVTRENNSSIVRSINIDDNAELEDALKQLGTRRSDIFGMDAVIWVEGKTDEICFNQIMEASLPFGVQIIGLVNTGDLEDMKHAQLAENIYEKLSGGVGILPSTLAFVYDGDKRPDDYNEENSIGSRTRYLKRQTFENYFLDFGGIADIFSELINSDDSIPPPQPVTPENVQAWIDEKREKKTFYNGEYIYDPETWLDQIHGARFLKTLFKELAHPARKYKKVKDGEEITVRILADNPDHFQEIVKLIKCILATDAEREIT